MKKLAFLTTMLLFGYGAMAQTGFRIGVNAGLPIGDTADRYKFNISADLAYLFQVPDDIHFGVASGYMIFFGEDKGTFDIEDASFLPIAGAARFNITDYFTIGGDVGYAVGLSPDQNDGGFYYCPRLHYHLSETVDVALSYRAVSVEGIDLNAISLGIIYWP